MQTGELSGWFNVAALLGLGAIGRERKTTGALRLAGGEFDRG